jgi:(R,R)-butanediol dehydrogenase / meso-butanediol dehydrogenase / diacetyl reductase
MLAARYLGPDRIEPIDISVPTLSDGEALIKVEACGFCGSDLGIVAGAHPRAKVPLTLGHEFCGTIEDVRGEHPDFRPGDRVTACPLIACGKCFVCREGFSTACRNLRLYGIDFDGAMAEYVRLPFRSLLRIPDGMSPILGALVEPLAVAIRGVALPSLTHPRTIVVMGAGPIGLLTALVASARSSCSVIVSDILPSRLALASQLGLSAVSSGAELKQSVDAATGGEGADLLFECTGVPSAARQMTDLVRPHGTIVNLGVFKKPAEIDLQAVNFKELTIVGSRVYTREQFEDAIGMAQTLPISQIVTHTFPLREVTRAFEYFRAGRDSCKIMLLPNGAVA